MSVAEFKKLVPNISATDEDIALLIKTASGQVETDE